MFLAFLSFPGIPQREKPLLSSGAPLPLFQKRQGLEGQAPTKVKIPKVRKRGLQGEKLPFPSPQKGWFESKKPRGSAGVAITILIAWYRPHFGPLARWGKKTTEKWIWAPLGQWEEKWPKNGKNCHYWPIVGQFSHFSAIFSQFRGGAKLYFSAIFFSFRAALYQAIRIARISVCWIETTSSCNLWSWGTEVQQAGQTARGQKTQYLLLTSLREVIALAISAPTRTTAAFLGEQGSDNTIGNKEYFKAYF